MTTFLDHIRALVEAEQGLTEALEQTLPLLSPHSNNLAACHNSLHHSSSSVIPPSSSSQRGVEPPLLPAPRSSADIPTILAVARAYSLRTSAPPAWNTNLPVVGFATPNPLPHQLRGGALGAMQLTLAREEKKRRRKELLAEEQREREKRLRSSEEREKANKAETIMNEKGEDGDNIDNKMDVVDDDGYTGSENPSQIKNDGTTKGTKNNDPKRQDMIERERVQLVQQQQYQQQQRQQKSSTSSGQQPEAGELHKKRPAVSMKLSDSSSSSSSGEEGSDDE
jgi:hypothetical protein